MLHKNKSKYMVKTSAAGKAARTDADGTVFGSKAELKRWKQLQLLERAGEISNLRRQVPFPFASPDGLVVKSKAGTTLKYVADHVYMDKSGVTHVEDVKGFQDKLSKLKIALVEAIYGVTVELVMK